MRGDAMQSAPAPSGGLGQLAQLARLIEQDQTLAAIVRGSRSEERAELSRGERPPPSLLVRENKAVERNREPEAASALVQFLDPPDYGAYDNPDYSNGLPDQRRGLRVFAALVGLVLVGSASAFGAWVLYDRRGRSDETRVMAASVSPDKAAPSPREPSRSDERPREPSDGRSVNATGRTMTGAEEPADTKPPMPQAPPPVGVTFGPAPTKVAELTPGPTPPVTPADTAQDQPPDVKKPAPRQAAPGVTEPSGPHGVRYVVQLSAERGEAAAHAKSQVLQTKYRNIFADRKPFIRRADLGDRGIYFRVQAGPFAIEEANQICGNLKKSGADCIVHRN